MKFLKILALSLATSPIALGSDVDTAFARFDELRASNATTSEKAIGAFEFFSDISRAGAQPKSYEGCLKTIKLGLNSSDPCMPINARQSGGGGTGGVD